MDIIMEIEDIKNIVDIIKIFYICLFTFYINFKLINQTIKINLRKGIIVIMDIIIISLICRFIKITLGFSYNLIFMVLLISIMFKFFAHQRFAYSLLITVISISINYIIFSLSVIISFLPTIIPTILLNEYNEYIGLILILITYSMIIWIFYRIKRFKKGFIFLQKNISSEYIDILVLNISIVILFCITILSNYNIVSSNTFGFSFFIFSIIMFITIQKSLQLYYKQKLQEREAEETKKELENKSKEIEELKEENLKLSKTNHSIAHKLKSLEYEVNQISSRNVIDNNKIMNKIEKLSTEMQDEFVNVDLEKTGISEIDTMLEYMQSECIKSKIEFELQINGNIHHMINKYIEKEDLEILLADHIKNAIIAINNSENINKNILVRIGIIDGFYSLYIYDSGIEFELETLINLGIKPSTTHEDDGGTGMGFMNTFDTLRKYKASLIIQEYGKPSKDNFTKVIKIIFDNKNEYKVLSYREKEIKEKDKNKRVSI